VREALAVSHIALLRGINVGKAKRIAMADLRALVEGLGYRDVATLLNSGNVVFTAPKSVKGDPAARIQKTIAAKLGVSARVTVLTAEELDVAVRDNPLLDIATDPSRLLVAVLADVADRPRLAALAKRDWGAERFAVGARVAYVWMPDGVLESAAAKALEREFGQAVTSRNWTTMSKLAALVGE
jgi:uncharacterized protein (DUF1697 family)